MFTHINPLLAYMKERGIDPYAVNSPLGMSVTRGYIGDIAMDKRRCSVKTLKAIEECTNGSVTAQSMIDHWFSLARTSQQDRDRQCEVTDQ